MTTSKLINYTTREFISENELELYVAKQDEIFTPDVIKEFSKVYFSFTSFNFFKNWSIL